MKSKVRVAAGKKSKRKGGRVERELVKFLHANGAMSARRTAQYNGKGEDSLSDVVAKELSHFHIECKGTAESGISKQGVSDWFNQVYEDSKEDKVPVIFHKANHKNWVVLVTDLVAELLDLPRNAFTTNSFTVVPSLCRLIQNDDGVPFDCLRFTLTDLTFAFAYPACTVLNGMYIYEDNFRDTVDRGRGDDSPVPTCKGSCGCS